MALNDIGDPAAPYLAGSYAKGGHNLQVVGNRAYIVSEQGLHILDVSDPVHNVALGVCSSGQAFDVAILRFVCLCRGWGI